jgi:hypothetical protein
MSVLLLSRLRLVPKAEICKHREAEVAHSPPNTDQLLAMQAVTGRAGKEENNGMPLREDPRKAKYENGQIGR